MARGKRANGSRDDFRDDEIVKYRAALEAEATQRLTEQTEAEALRDAELMASEPKQVNDDWKEMRAKSLLLHDIDRMTKRIVPVRLPTARRVPHSSPTIPA